MEKMEEKLQRLAPVLTDKELQEINGLFTAYTFRRSKTRELWTTCCGKHKVIREERATAAEETALYTRHTPAPKYRWGMCTNTIDIKRRVACPWCGKETIPKELQYTGQRKNLWEYRRAVVLRQWRGALWACAYDCFKDYGRELTHLPKVKLLGVYRFRPARRRESTGHGMTRHRSTATYARRLRAVVIRCGSSQPLRFLCRIRQGLRGGRTGGADKECVPVLLHRGLAERLRPH